MVAVRAKFKVASKRVDEYGKEANGTIKVITSVKMTAVYGDSPENKAFFAASPSGTIELGVLNQPAADALEIGKEYYIDFTPAD